MLMDVGGRHKKTQMSARLDVNRYCRHGSDLATIRNAVELDRLPEGERAEILAFWESVKELHAVAAGH